MTVVDECVKDMWSHAKTTSDSDTETQRLTPKFYHAYGKKTIYSRVPISRVGSEIYLSG